MSALKEINAGLDSVLASVKIMQARGVELAGEVEVLKGERFALQRQLDAESDIQHAQRQEIAALGLVNKELADALLKAYRSFLAKGLERLDYRGWPEEAEAALRAAGRLKGENDA